MQRENIAITKAGYKPNVVAFGEFSYSKPDSTEIGAKDWGHAWQAGAQLSWNLFDGNKTRGNMIKERAELQRLEVERDQAVTAMKAEVEDALAGVASAEELVKSQTMALVQAEEALRLARECYEAGTATQLEVLDAETQLSSARLAVAEARFALGMAEAGLIGALGLTEMPVLGERSE